MDVNRLNYRYVEFLTFSCSPIWRTDKFLCVVLLSSSWSSMLQAVINKIHWCVAVCAINCTDDRRSQLLLARPAVVDAIAICWPWSSYFCLTHIHSRFNALVRGYPSAYCRHAWCGKLEWRGYPTVKKMKICLFVSTESTNVTDRQTDDGWTPHNTPRLCIASHGNKRKSDLDRAAHTVRNARYRKH